MEHLVKAHDIDLYYVSHDSVSVIRETCPECGSWDNIILSYEDGEKDKALEEYFSRIHNDNITIIKCTDAGLTKKQLITSSIIHFGKNEELIHGLYESDIISKEDMKKYLKLSKEKEKEDLKRIKKSLRLHLSCKERKENR
jgi:hypothetical protein